MDHDRITLHGNIVYAVLSKYILGNIGQGNYLCDVDPECTNMFLQENQVFFVFLFNWDLLHARLNSHYKTWSYKKKKLKKIKAHKKSV